MGVPEISRRLIGGKWRTGQRDDGGGNGNGGSQPGASRWTGPYKINFATQQTIGGTAADGGTFTLTVNSETTEALPFNATDTQLTAAIEALPSIGAGNVTVAMSGAGGIDVADATFSFSGVLATGLLTADVTNLTLGGDPYPGSLAIAPGNDAGKTVVELFTPAVGDIIEDFAHAVVTAFDAGGLNYTDDPTDDTVNGPGWAVPGPQIAGVATSAIDLTIPDDSFTNFYGYNLLGINVKQSVTMVLTAAFAAEPTATQSNMPAVVKVAVPLYAFLENMTTNTQGEVWIWAKTSTPAPPS